MSFRRKCRLPVALAIAWSLPAMPAPAADQVEAKSERPTTLRAPPAGFVDLAAAVPGIRLEIRYHTAGNFTGAPLPGYGAPGAWMLEAPAKALAQVQADLAPKGIGLLVYDAYRPRRASQAMVAWAERTGQIALVNGGYIARRSGHNHGHTIDLTLVDLKTGQPLEMGTDFDTLSPESHTMRAKGKALENRLLLKKAMEARGFRGYSKEWWHFSFPIKGSKARDVPYACFEADEGRWSPPEGWSEKGFEMPKTWEPTPCGAR